MTYTPSKDFDESQRLIGREGRFQMAGDINKSKMLIGKDPNQVKQLLRDPAWRSDTTYQSELRGLNYINSPTLCFATKEGSVQTCCMALTVGARRLWKHPKNFM